MGPTWKDWLRNGVYPRGGISLGVECPCCGGGGGGGGGGGVKTRHERIFPRLTAHLNQNRLHTISPCHVMGCLNISRSVTSVKTASTQGSRIAILHTVLYRHRTYLWAEGSHGVSIAP